MFRDIIRPGKISKDFLRSSIFQTWRIDKRLVFLDLALFFTALLLIFTQAKVFLFHIVFILLTLGAFYWHFRAFVIRAVFWVLVTTLVVAMAILAQKTQVDEIIEIPLLTTMLILVFAIAEQRSSAQAALRKTNEALESRVAERTAELTRVNLELTREINQHKALLNTIPDSIFHLSSDGDLLDYRIQHSNTPSAVFKGLDIKSLADFAYLWPELAGTARDYIHQAITSGEMQIVEYEFPLASEQRTFEIRLVVSGPNELLAIVRDITSHKTRAAALERERARIARDLHDSLGQNLGYLHLKLDELASSHTVAELEQIRPLLIQMRAVANEAYELVRSMIAAARPSNSTNLAAALLTLAQSIGNRAHFKVNLTRVGQPWPLPPVVQQQVLYIFQEALSNVSKHAKAGQVGICLLWTEALLTVILTDDGCGFDPNAPREDGHFGLNIMQERAEEINGFLSIASRPQGGTELTLQLPFSPAAQPHILHNAT